MAAELAAVVEAEQDLVLHQLEVDAGHALLQASVQLWVNNKSFFYIPKSRSFIVLTLRRKTLMHRHM